MSWFLLAIIGPFLYAITNHIDKILLEKYFKEGGVGTLLLFSSLLSVFVLPILFFADPTVLDVDLISILTLSVVSILYVIILWLYFLALKEEEASITVVFYQLVPVFGFILGYYILDEVLTSIQLIAMAIIVFGTTIVAFELDAENKFSIKSKTVSLMLTASFCWALGSVIFKAVALEENVLRSLFWEHMMLLLIGILIFTFIPNYRKHFLLALRNNSKGIISLNFTNEALYIAGNTIVAFAFLLAPISLILLAESFQPIFVLAIGIFLTVFFPKISSENIETKYLWQKGAAICITGAGTYLLLVY